MKKRYISIILIVITMLVCTFTFCGGCVKNGLSYRKKKGEYILIGCQKEANGQIYIPSEINGIKVTTIGEEAFKDCNLIKEIIMPESIKKIEDYAFAGCDGLLKVTISESVETIGYRVFKDCSKITEINYNAIAGDWLYLWEEGNAENGIILNIGSKVSTIKGFGGDNIIEVNFEPDSVCKSIREDAFKNCNKLTTITLPASLEEFSTSAFAYCESLTSVYFEDPNNWKWTPMFTYDVDLSNPVNNIKFFRERNAALIYKDKC